MIHHLTTTTTTLFIKSSLPFAYHAPFQYEYHNEQNPRPRPRPRRRRSISQWSIPRCCKKEQVYPNPQTPRARAKRSSNVGIITATGKSKEIDVATLGNLCVDIVLNVPELPPNDPALRKLYMDRLSASPPDKVSLFISLTFNFQLSIFNFFFFNLLIYNNNNYYYYSNTGKPVVIAIWQ